MQKILLGISVLFLLAACTKSASNKAVVTNTSIKYQFTSQTSDKYLVMYIDSTGATQSLYFTGTVWSKTFLKAGPNMTTALLTTETATGNSDTGVMSISVGPTVESTLNFTMSSNSPVASINYKL
jgi:hypothetical protein